MAGLKQYQEYPWPQNFLMTYNDFLKDIVDEKGCPCRIHDGSRRLDAPPIDIEATIMYIGIRSNGWHYVYDYFANHMALNDIGQKHGVTSQRASQAIRSWFHQHLGLRTRELLNDGVQLTIQRQHAGSYNTGYNSGYATGVIEGKYEALHPKKAKEDPSDAKILNMSIEECEFSIRSYNCLKRAGVESVGDLVNLTEEQLMKVRNLGRRSYDEIMAKITKFGLSLREED